MKIVWSVRPWERWTLSAIAAGMLVGAVVTAIMWREAHSTPVVTRYDVPVRGLAQSVTVAVLSDTHVNQDRLASSVDLRRLRSVVEATNALRPDLVVLAGDYVATSHRSGDVPIEQAVAPFAGLRSRYGTFSVVGNHDCQEVENTAPRIRRALVAAATTPLVNETVRAGPLLVVGLDDLWCGSSDVGTATRAVGNAAGLPVLLVSHNPDVFPNVPRDVALTIAGHTHAGQIVPPVLGPVVSVSRFGHRYRYGMIAERDRRMIVSAGIGGLPLRWNAKPEIVFVTLVPAGFTEAFGGPRA